MSDFDWGNTPKGQTKSSTSYIDRENLLREVYKKTANDRTIYIDCMASFVNLVNEQLSADVVEVVHGEWKECEIVQERLDEPIIDEWQSARCSACGKYHTTPYMYYFDNFKYCPSCGARMDGEA